jgi:hypothetical protein
VCLVEFFLGVSVFFKSQKLIKGFSFISGVFRKVDFS